MAATNIEVWQSATVVETVPVADGILRIVLEPSLPKRAEPGAHIDLKVVIGGEDAKRSYSVVESNDDGTRLVDQRDEGAAVQGRIDLHARPRSRRSGWKSPSRCRTSRCGSARRATSCWPAASASPPSPTWPRCSSGSRPTTRSCTWGAAARPWPTSTSCAELHGDRLEVHVDDEGTSLSVPELVGRADAGTELYMCGPIRLMDAVRRSWVERELRPAEPALRDLRQQRLVRPRGIHRQGPASWTWRSPSRRAAPCSRRSRTRART